MPFKYGIATLMALPHVIVELALEIDGRPSRVGREELGSAALEGRAAGRVGPGSRKYHVVIPGGVEVDGDRATCESRFLFIGHADEAPALLSVGRYHDRLRRSADGWQLMARRIEFG
jgi:hypothetical protein